MTCIPDSQIESYLNGDMPIHRIDAVSAHIGSCAKCELRACELELSGELLMWRGKLGIFRCGLPAADWPMLHKALANAMCIPDDDTRPQGADTTGSDRDQHEQIQQLVNGLSPPQSADELGRLGEFRILGIAGVGGMAVVFRAEDMRLLRPVALKVLQPAVAGRLTARERFQHEAQAVAAIHHEHVVSIHEVGEANGLAFFAMPLMNGESLQHRIVAIGRLPLRETLRIGSEIAMGLDAAHQANVLHRDIKPDNIWLEGNNASVRILDFGLANDCDSRQRLTASNVVVGTPRFMSPEQAMGHGTDQRSDLFSMGSVIYYMATGRLPFDSESATGTLIAVAQQNPTPVRQYDPMLPKSFEQLTQKLMAKAPADRFESAAKVLAAIREIQNDLDDSAKSRSHQMQSRVKLPAIATFGFAVTLLLVLSALVAGNYGIQGQTGRILSPHHRVSRDSNSLFEQRQPRRHQKTNMTEIAASTEAETAILRQLTPDDGWVSLISLLNSPTQEKCGGFLLRNGRLISTGSRDTLVFPVRFHGAYDIQITIARWFTRSNHHTDFYLPFDHAHLPLYRIGYDETNSGKCSQFSDGSNSSPLAILPFSTGDPVNLTLSVRLDGNVANYSALLLNGEAETFSRTTPHAKYAGRFILMDLMAGREFSEINVRMISGHAEIVE